MKKVLLAVLVTATLASCETTVSQKSTGETMDGMPIRVIVFDSCEYVLFPGGNASWGGHKGNCKFCKQRSINSINK